MDGEAVLGAIIMVLCCWGCAAIFTGIAIYARKRKDPINFWSGVKVNPASVRDIPAYNRENSTMWLVYSVPYWICGGVSLFFRTGDHAVVLSVAILMLACFPGIYFLIRHYRKIERKYIDSKRLDKNDHFC